MNPRGADGLLPGWERVDQMTREEFEDFREAEMDSAQTSVRVWEAARITVSSCAVVIDTKTSLGQDHVKGRG